MRRSVAAAFRGGRFSSTTVVGLWLSTWPHPLEGHFSQGLRQRTKHTFNCPFPHTTPGPPLRQRKFCPSAQQPGAVYSDYGHT